MIWVNVTFVQAIVLSPKLRRGTCPCFIGDKIFFTGNQHLTVSYVGKVFCSIASLNRHKKEEKYTERDTEMGAINREKSIPAKKRKRKSRTIADMRETNGRG